MIKLPSKKAVGSAHSKLILVGEHAVVYGKPAIALPFPLIEVTSTVEEIYGAIRIESRYYVGTLKGVPKKLQGIAACIEETLKVLNKPSNGLLIRLDSMIPIGRGLGSSAAIAIAIVRSLFAYYGKEASKKELMALVHLAETYAHGNPSGIDMAAACSDLPIWFQKDREIKSIDISTAFHLVVADTGRIGDTHAAVKSIKERHKLEPDVTQRSIDQLGNITHRVRLALTNDDTRLLGNLLNLAQDELTILGVSDTGINRLVKAARSSGALGAKLTGGGRGGCIIALAKSLEHAKVIADDLVRKGANNTWYFTIGN